MCVSPLDRDWLIISLLRSILRSINVNDDVMRRVSKNDKDLVEVWLEKSAEATNIPTSWNSVESCNSANPLLHWRETLV